MKKLLILYLLMFITVICTASERKKVGLVLGGGGAKGVAHIGVLKVLEEAGIPIDYIAGTSMGAIVGGLYAIGYDAASVDSMLNRQNWGFLLSDKTQREDLSYSARERSERYFLTLPFGLTKEERRIRGAIEGQNLLNLFSYLTIGYHDSTDFNRFKIPFACVAVDAVSGKDFVFHAGDLPLAMRASMAIPAIFSPVRLNGMVLVDGGVNNNFPVDVVRSMGADYVIGVDLGTSDLKTEQGINTPADLIGQIVALHGYDKYISNKQRTDLLIRPNLLPYNAASFYSSSLETMIRRGEWETRNHWDELMALKKQLGLDSTSIGTDRAIMKTTAIQKDSLSVRRIIFEGIDSRDEKWLKKISNLKENTLISIADLQKSISILAGTDLYAQVNYRLLNQSPYDLVILMKKKPSSSLNAGLRFDSEELAAILLNATLDFRSTYQSRASVTGRVGRKTSFISLDFTGFKTLSRNINFSYRLDYKNLDIFDHGKKTINTTYLHHLAEIGYSDMNWLGFMMNIGVRYEYYDYTSFLFTNADLNYQVKPDGYFNYFLKARFETLDRQYFPTKGVSLEADYTVYTDNLLQYKGETPFSSVKLGMTSVIPLNEKTYLIPTIYGRALLGDNPAYPFFNAIGGEVSSRFLPQQLPFAGISNLEIINKALLTGGINIRQQIGATHYLSLRGNIGFYHDDVLHVLNGGHLLGACFGYTYNSLFGPMSVNIGYSNRTEKPQLFINLGFYF